MGRILLALFLLLPCALPAAPRPVARTAALELLFDGGNGDVVVRDLRSGEVWSSVPPASPGDATLSEALRGERGSPFLLSYRDSDMKVAYSANRSSTGVTLSAALIPGGVRATYRIAARVVTTAAGGGTYAGTLGFDMDYTLEGDSLRVSIPGSAVVEQGDFILVSLQVLPFFGASADTSSGSLVLPDGAGAVAEFRRPAPQSTAFFSLPVYGEERFTFTPRRRSIGSLLPEELAALLKGFDPRPAGASLAAFGLLRRGRGIAGVIEAGEMYARVRGALAGVIYDCSRIGVDFDYRIPYVTFLSRSRTDTRYLRTIIPGDRAVRYVFLPGPGADVAQVAAAARASLASRTPPALAAAPEAPGLDLRVFCSIGERRLLGTRIVVATTFAQAADIVRYAVGRGLSSLSLTLVGWESGGYQGRLPRKLPPERRLGGEKGLADLVRACHDLGVPVYLEADYLLAVPGGRGFSIGRDAIAEPSRLPITDGSGTFLVSPRAARERLAPSELDRLRRLGVDGVTFAHMADVLISDYGHGITREQTVEELKGIIRLARDRGLRVRVQGGSSWAVGSVNALCGVPLTDSGYPFARGEPVLYPAALHGLAGLISAPLNLSSSLVDEVLRAVDLGVTPSLELTAADPAVLRETAYNGLFRARSTEVLDAVAGVLAPVAQGLSGLAPRAMVARLSAAPGVTVTRYAGGDEIVVNTTGGDVSWRGAPVPARSGRYLSAGARP